MNKITKKDIMKFVNHTVKINNEITDIYHYVVKNIKNPSLKNEANYFYHLELFMDKIIFYAECLYEKNNPEPARSKKAQHIKWSYNKNKYIDDCVTLFYDLVCETSTDYRKYKSEYKK